MFILHQPKMAIDIQVHYPRERRDNFSFMRSKFTPVKPDGISDSFSSVLSVCNVWSRRLPDVNWPSTGDAMVWLRNWKKPLAISDFWDSDIDLVNVDIKFSHMPSSVPNGLCCGLQINNRFVYFRTGILHIGHNEQNVYFLNMDFHFIEGNILAKSCSTESLYSAASNGTARRLEKEECFV